MKQITWHNNHNEHDENSTQREREGGKRRGRDQREVIDKYAKAGNEGGKLGLSTRANIKFYAT